MRKKPKPRTHRVRSKNTRFHFKEADFITLEVLQYGPLSSKYLYEFTKHLRQDETGQRKRLRQLYDLGYVDRPKGLNNNLVWGDAAVYSLDVKGKEALGDRLNRFAPLPIANIHNYWNATIIANLRLYLPGFMTSEEVLEHSPDETKLTGKPLAIPRGNQKTTIPDDLGAISYGELGERYLLIETDCGNENYESSDITRKTTDRMITEYKDILEYGWGKEHFGIPNVFPVFFFPRESRTKRVMEDTLKIHGGACKNILFKTVPMDTRPFKSAPLMPEIASTPFLRAGCSPFDILNPDRQ